MTQKTDRQPAAQCPVTHFDMLDRKHLRGEWKAWREIADGCPVFKSDAYEANGFYVLTSYKDIMYVLRNPEIFSSHRITIPPLVTPRPQIPIEIDPPMHRKYRKPIVDYFSHASQAKREPIYRETAAQLVDSVFARGECDIADELCFPLPVLSVMSMLNVDEVDRPKLVRSLLDMTHPPGKEDDPARAAELATEATTYAYSYFAGLLPDRRANPGDDVISLLCGIDVDGHPLSDDEVLDYTILICAAGFETTASSMSYGFLLLSQDAQLRQRLVDDPGLIPEFVEEVMRFEQPTKGLARTVTQPAEISGVNFVPGDRLLLLYAAANRDPEVFPDPDEFVLGRSPNRHFGFGAGPHLCVGIHMARLEMRLMFEEFLKRIPVFTIDTDQVVESTGATYVVTSLPVTWPV